MDGEAASGLVILLVLFVVGFCGYLLPSIVAFNRNHRNKVPIAILNLLLGWTLIGWVVALVWSCLADVNQQSAYAVASPVDSIILDHSRRLSRRAQIKELGLAILAGAVLLGFVHWLFGF